MTHPTPQELFLMLIEQTRYENFDGAQIATWLRTNSEKWVSVLLDGGSTSGYILRDLPNGFYHADTLYILTTTAYSQLIRHVAEMYWAASDITTIKGDELSRHIGEWLPSTPDRRRIIKIWWD